jgi:diguanylate cyclase (GGDEF)-like protein
MEKGTELRKMIDSFVVTFPPEIEMGDLTSLGGRINTILQSPIFLNQAGSDDFFPSYANHVMEIIPEIGGVMIFTIEGENGEATFHAFGEIDREKIPTPYEEFLPLMGVSVAGKPVHFVKGGQESIDEVLIRLNAGSMAAFPVLIDNEFRGAFVFIGVEGHTLTPMEIKVLWNLSFYGDLHFKIKESSKSLAYYALYDSLTGLYNRRVFNDRLEQEVLKSRRTGNPFTMLMIDLDHFKGYNDRFQHTFGDLALQELAEILKTSVREVDTVARLGGDEFGAILSGTGSNDSLIVCERTLKKVMSHLFYDDNYERTQKLTISVGASVYPQDAFSGHELIKKADSALFTAKKLGGNRVIRNEDMIMMHTGAGPVVQEIQPQSLFEAMRTVFNFEKFMSLLLNVSMDGVNADRGSFFVKDLDEPEYILLVSQGFSAEGNGKPEKIYGGEIIKRIVQEGKPYLHVEGSDPEIRNNLKREGFYNESFISVPLKRDGDVIGVLNFSNKRENGRFSKDDLDKIGTLLDSVGRILDEGITFKTHLRDFGGSALTTMSRAFEIKFPYYRNHSEEVADLCVNLGKKYSLDERTIEKIRTAALIHDVGMLCVPTEILNKKETLADNEIHYVRKHPYIGWKILENFPQLEEERKIVLYHHERADGSGYPFGLKGEDIPLEASILSIAEFYASITRKRPYREKIAGKEALNLLDSQSGLSFNPSLIRHLKDIVQ